MKASLHKFILMGFAGLVVATAAWAQGPNGEDGDTSYIRVAHSEIEGKVYIAGVERGQRERPAEDVDVQIREEDGDEILSKTKTNEHGAYYLPKTDPGKYDLLIGGLKLHLSVESDDTKWSDQLRKVIIVVIPEEMARRR